MNSTHKKSKGFFGKFPREIGAVTFALRTVLAVNAAGFPSMLLLIAGLCISVRPAFAVNGTVVFDNLVPTQGVNAPIFYAGQNACGGPPGAFIDGGLHPTAFAALYGGPDGTSEENLVLVSIVAGFRTGLKAGYVNAGSAAFTVLPNIRAGTFGIFQVRAWDACNTAIQSYEDAVLQPGALVGKSNLLRFVTGGAGSPPGGPAYLVGLESFGIADVPEPSSLALAFVAGVCVWACRGKRRV